MRKIYHKYKFSDLILPSTETPQKYIKVYDNNGNFLGEIECSLLEFDIDDR